MKTAIVYVCFMNEAHYGDKLLGIFLNRKDAEDMALACKTGDDICRVEEHEVIE